MEKNEGLGNVRAAIYARTATPKSACEEGNLDMQVERCLRYAAEKNYDVPPEHIWRLVGSGVDPHLAGLTELMAVIDAGEVDVVLVCGVDRLSRSLVQLLFMAQSMKAKGVHLVVVGEGGGKRLSSPVEVATAVLDARDPTMVWSGETDFALLDRYVALVGHSEIEDS